jgi:hypothetical protein
MAMTRDQLLDLYFIDARSKLIDVAALLDRVERTGESADYRIQALLAALRELPQSRADTGRSRAERALLAFTDPSTTPIAKAPMQGATGAYQPAS